MLLNSIGDKKKPTCKSAGLPKSAYPPQSAPRPVAYEELSSPPVKCLAGNFENAKPAVPEDVPPGSHMQPVQRTRQQLNLSDIFKAENQKQSLARSAPPGMRNHGNTCYLNATLQVLLSLSPFVDDMLDPVLQNLLPSTSSAGTSASTCKGSSSMNTAAGTAGTTTPAPRHQSTCLKTVVPPDTKSLKTQRLRVLPLTSALSSCLNERTAAAAANTECHREFPCISPLPVKVALAAMDERWRGMGQQDAHEFLVSLLNTLQGEVHAAQEDVGHSCKDDQHEQKPSPSSSVARSAEVNMKSINLSKTVCPVSKNFSGCLQHDLRCQTCGCHTKVKEQFYHLSLQLPMSSSTAPLKLKSLLTSHFKDEVVDKECVKCGTASVAHQVKHSIRRLPRVLVIHLKRFNVIPQEGGPIRFVKLHTGVELSNRLSLEPFCLQGISAHPLLLSMKTPGSHGSTGDSDSDKENQCDINTTAAGRSLKAQHTSHGNRFNPFVRNPCVEGQQAAPLSSVSKPFEAHVQPKRSSDPNQLEQSVLYPSAHKGLAVDVFGSEVVDLDSLDVVNLGGEVVDLYVDTSHPDETDIIMCTASHCAPSTMKAKAPSSLIPSFPNPAVPKSAAKAGESQQPGLSPSNGDSCVKAPRTKAGLTRWAAMGAGPAGTQLPQDPSADMQPAGPASKSPLLLGGKPSGDGSAFKVSPTTSGGRLSVEGSAQKVLLPLRGGAFFGASSPPFLSMPAITPARPSLHPSPGYEAGSRMPTDDDGDVFMVDEGAQLAATIERSKRELHTSAQSVGSTGKKAKVTVEQHTPFEPPASSQLLLSSQPASEHMTVDIMDDDANDAELQAAIQASMRMQYIVFMGHDGADDPVRVARFTTELEGSTAAIPNPAQPTQPCDAGLQDKRQGPSLSSQNPPQLPPPSELELNSIDVVASPLTTRVIKPSSAEAQVVLEDDMSSCTSTQVLVETSPKTPAPALQAEGTSNLQKRAEVIDLAGMDEEEAQLQAVLEASAREYDVQQAENDELQALQASSYLEDCDQGGALVGATAHNLTGDEAEVVGAEGEVEQAVAAEQVQRRRVMPPPALPPVRLAEDSDDEGTDPPRDPSHHPRLEQSSGAPAKPNLQPLCSQHGERGAAQHDVSTTQCGPSNQHARHTMEPVKALKGSMLVIGGGACEPESTKRAGSGGGSASVALSSVASYMLQGIVSHKGVTPLSGHYIADIVRSRKAQPKGDPAIPCTQWDRYNDESVKPISALSVMQDAASQACTLADVNMFQV
eukprot:gene16636-22885_t